MIIERRNVVLAGTCLALAAPALLAKEARGEGVAEKLKEVVTGKKGDEVSPPEDLMREHGVLDRVLLVYEAGTRKLSSNEDFDPGLLVRSAEIIRDFINNYHEKSEEDHVFPRFEKAGKMVDLVATLRRQHDAGRQLTQTIIRLAPSSRTDAEHRTRLVDAIGSFITMYRPHAAREDTELFPKLKSVVSSNEYDSMAEEFERQEHQLFGAGGFEKFVGQVADLERQMGISDLNQFTPR